MKRLLKAFVSVVLSLCLVFGLAACTEGGNGNTPSGDNPSTETPGGENPGGENPGGENPGEENPDGETPGGGEMQAAALLDEALLTLAEQDYVTFDFDMTGRQIGGTDDALHTAEMLVQLAQDEKYGYDIFARQSSDGEVTSESLFVDGMRYATQMIDGKLWYYVSGSMGGSLGPNPDPVLDIPAEVTNSGSTASDNATHSWISLFLGSGNLFQTYGALLSLAGLDSLAGIEGAVTQTSGGTQLSLTVQLDEARQSLIDWLDALKSQSLDGLEAVVNELYDEDITVVEFLDKLDSILSPNGLALEELLTDEYIATVLIAGFSNGMPPADILETIYGNTAQYLYEVLMENAGEQIGNILSKPKAGESVYTYARRIFGQFKVTGIIDMITGETGSGAEGFAEIKEQFSAWAEGKSAYDAANFVIQQMTGSDSYEEFDAVVLLQAFTFEESYAECSVTLDGNARITEASFEIDFTMLDTNDEDDYYVDGVPHIQLDGTLNVSYDAFTLEAPSADQLIPVIGTPQIDEAEGTVFIPVEWNGVQPGDAGSDVCLNFVAYPEEGSVGGEGSLEIDLPIEQTAEGILIDVDLTEEWQELRRMIDKELAQFAPFDTAYFYDIQIDITIGVFCLNLSVFIEYDAEGNEITMSNVMVW